MKKAILIASTAVLLLFGAAPGASADLVLGSYGSGAGQYQNAQGVAVDTSSGETASGRVYVADTGNNRVDVFDEAGAFLFSFGSLGTGAGQLKSPNAIAVDPASHAVYVAEDPNHRVQKFDYEGHFLWMAGKGVNAGNSGNPDLCTDAGPPSDVCGAGAQGEAPGEFHGPKGVAVGAGETVFVADNSGNVGTCPVVGGGMFEKRIQSFGAGGSPIEVIEPADVPCGQIQGFAVEPGGDFYLANAGGSGAVRKYDETGAPVTAWGEAGAVDPSFNIQAIALDPAGQLFVSDSTGKRNSLLRYDATGDQNLIFFGEGTLNYRPIALAFHSTATGDLYAVEGRNSASSGRVVQLALPAPGPLFVPGTTEACPAANVRATLCTTFNPEGKASSAHFEYISKADYEADGESFGTGTHVTPESEPSPASFENQTVSAANVCAVPDEATCLSPETTYYFRAIASNADGEVTGKRAEFTTLPPHGIEAIWAGEVGTDTARLSMRVNPLGIAATAHFEYLSEAEYEAGGFAGASSSPDFSLGAGEAPLTRAAQIQGLEPGIAYRYRVVVEDAYFPPTVSGAQGFATFSPPAAGEEACANAAYRTGSSAALPDCRAYELVTPLDKSNGDVLTRTNVTGYETDLEQASTDGGRFAYSSYRAFADPQSAPYTNQYMATRTAGGWSSENLDPPRSSPPFIDDLENEYKAFSPDLSLGWMVQEGDPTLDPCAAKGVEGLYRRQISPASYAALSCAPVGQVAKDRLHLPAEYRPELQGLSADGQRAVFRIDDALTEGASTATTATAEARPIVQTYLSLPNGSLRLISVLPDGEPSEEDSSAGTAFSFEKTAYNQTRFNVLTHAISEDGSRVFWSTGTGQGLLYLRLNADQAQSSFDGEGKCKQPTRACTVLVSGTVTAEPARFQAADPQGDVALFTVTQGPEAGDLYRYDLATRSSTLLAEGAIGSILGASEDLARVYFASTAASGAQEAEGAVAGQPNVYLHAEGASRFVATLSSGTNSDLINPYGEPNSTTPIYRTARVAPDGRSLVFMSNSAALAERTAGYDNTDLNSGQPVFEVYRYEGGALACISCNPTGARPRGQVIAKASTGNPDAIGAAEVPLATTDLYQPRYLSDDGSRAFFESFEALVLADTNGKADVYEWEAPGTGGCTAESPGYVKASQGCLALISSGKGPDGARLLDASPSGNDVFFATAESLLPQDYGLIDAYDARMGGGFPPPPAPPAACEGEACQPAAQAPSARTPASAAFHGPGNLAEPHTRRPRCPKGARKVRRKGKVRCLKAKHRRRHRKHHRRAHRKQAHGNRRSHR